MDGDKCRQMGRSEGVLSQLVDAMNVGSETVFAGVDPGLYVLHWKSGGSSLASVGMDENGKRWFATINWITVPSFNWNLVQVVEPIIDPRKGESYRTAFVGHVMKRDDVLMDALVRLENANLMLCRKREDPSANDVQMGGYGTLCASCRKVLGIRRWSDAADTQEMSCVQSFTCCRCQLPTVGVPVDNGGTMCVDCVKDAESRSR